MNLDSADGHARTVGESYTVRPYEPGDRDDVVDLYESVFGGDGDEIFSWKYESNPFVDHVPMTVAVEDDRVVAIKPCLALPLRAGERTVLALQPADVAVHADHRGNGLYSATTELLKDRYRHREPGLFFNFPNRATLSGSLKHDWRVVEEVSTCYRVSRIRPLLGNVSTAVRLATRPVDGLLVGYRRLRDAVRRAPNDVAVTRLETTPVDRLVELYHAGVPDGFHAHRTETYLRWRFANPDWEYSTYTATRRGSIEAGVVVGTRSMIGTDVVSVVDVFPPVDAGERRDAVLALLQDVLTNHRDASLVAVAPTAVPDGVLATLGFRDDARWPLSLVADRSTLVAYPLTDGSDWTVADRVLTDPDNWHLTLTERDTR